MALTVSPLVRTPAKIGAGLFLLWSVLHIYVGVAGAVEYFTGDITSQWTLLIGGTNAPVSGFQFPTDALTANAQSHLLLNFCLDVGGYGVLGVIVAWTLGLLGLAMAIYLAFGLNESPLPMKAPPVIMSPKS